ncbi:histidinol-phosphate transaminase [Patiriisocius sp. Uisw_017]|jgi:histidinol-phosphate aminotransferase|uniref:histidinol-phosphate transaminase n=1 Tax=Patiriisocius sp. Uisw_017 TaxID=3230968 RepID=UPI0039EC3F12
MKNKFNISKLVRPNVLALKPYSSARDEFKDAARTMTFLDANENPFETNINRYPDPQQHDLKTILAKQKGAAISQILLGNGSDEVLDLIVRAFCEPRQDNVITLPPTYGMYKVLAEINAIENREVLLTKNFEPNVSKILKTQDANSKVLFLCTPNNPTGNVFSKDLIEQLLESFNGLLVIDEAYIDFSETESWLSRLEEFPNLIITQTLSKAYGMAGIRLGICYASTEIISILNKIKPPYNINSLTQVTATQKIRDIKKLNIDKSLILRDKERLKEVLLQLKFIDTVYPSQANFLLVKVDNATKRYEQLLDNGIVVRDRSSQPLCENTLRLTVGTPEENNTLIKILKGIL